MSEWTQGQLDALIAERKQVATPPRKRMTLVRGSYRSDMLVESMEGERKFRVFLRQLASFPENFSIGMDVLLPDGSSLCLIRCNGPHEGPNVAGTDARPLNHHFGYHIHRAKADNLAEGLRAERGAEITGAYGSFGEAIAFFMRTCGVEGAEQYFKDLTDRHLFDESGEHRE